MKSISTLFLAMLFIASSILSYSQNDNAREGFTVYSNNDSNAVVVSSFYYDHLPWATNLNIAKGTSETFELEIMNSSDLRDIQMNSNTRFTYYFTNNEVFIYEFGATKSTRIITLDNGGDNYGVSNDGSKIYSYSKEQEYVSIFDAITGERLDRFFVNSFKGALTEGFFNSEKDEFLLRNGNTLYVWSIANKVQDREITLPNSVKNLTITDNGNVLAYTVGGEVILTNSSDGEITYRKQFDYDSIKNIQFSANMNYLIVREFYSFLVYDMDNKKIIKDNKASNNNGKNLPTYLYVNNDNSRAIAMDIIDIYCGRNFEDAVTDYIYSIYKTENLDKLASAPYGYIPRPEKAIVSKDNKLLVVSGGDIEATITNALVDNQENFIKYINVDAYPLTFLEDNNRVAFIEDGIFKVYNTESEEFEREFDTGMDDYNDVYFFANGDGRIVITDDSEIKVFDYATFELVYTFNYSQLGLEPTDISFDNNSTISVYSLKRLHNFNAYTGEKSDTPITNMDTANKLVDVSISGRFLLFRTEDYEFIVYDNTLKAEVYREKPSVVKNGMVYLSAGFFGNHEIMWIRYENDPVFADPSVAIYDFVNDKTEEMFGDSEPVISNDGTLYYSHYCPVKYEIGAIRDPQTSVETTTTIIGGVYPNPASDFIKLDMKASAMNSSVEIYDAYGKQVMSIIYAGENIDISKLTAGVYYVKMGKGTHKFVKM